MPHVNLSFPVIVPPGQTLPTDHSFSLYAALCRAVPVIHESDYRLAIAPIGGVYIGQGKIQLARGARLKLRLPLEQVAALLPLAGQALDLDGVTLRLGVPRLMPLEPAPCLYACLVTIKNHQSPETLLVAARQQFAQLGLAGAIELAVSASGPRAGQARRRVLRIHGRRIVGYALQASGLSAADSMCLQEAGLGGRRKLGCGIFEPVKD